MKKMIIGIVIGLFLGISTNAFAAIGDTVQAVFASFQYAVNGTTKSIDSPVLVYEGTSYVRTTDIGNLLGFDVTYKADSRTIAFNNPLSAPIVTGVTPAPSSTPTTSPAPSSTPAPSTSPAPSASPAPTISPEPSASPSPSPSVSPTPTVSPSPSPSPTNLAACQAIRDKYGFQIATADIGGGSDGQIRTKIYYLEYYRDQELAAAGCN